MNSRHFRKTALLLIALLSGVTTCNAQGPQVRLVTSLPYAGWLDFNLSKPGQLVTIVALEAATGDSIPIARSYDGRPFEVAPGPYVNVGVPINCATGLQYCGVDIAGVKRTGSLQEITYSSYLDPNSQKGIDAITARFLEQATYVDLRNVGIVPHNYD